MFCLSKLLCLVNISLLCLLNIFLKLDTLSLQSPLICLRSYVCQWLSRNWIQMSSAPPPVPLPASSLMMHFVVCTYILKFLKSEYDLQFSISLLWGSFFFFSQIFILEKWKPFSKVSRTVNTNLSFFINDHLEILIFYWIVSLNIKRV